ncbi:MAG TPA: hypothetical protein VHO23_02520 [Candidatus Paceibacterota bacterium]|nr:hypothetical protein [Candidatus Paceibacterota bacterium]
MERRTTDRYVTLLARNGFGELTDLEGSAVLQYDFDAFPQSRVPFYFCTGSLESLDGAHTVAFIPSSGQVFVRDGMHVLKRPPFCFRDMGLKLLALYALYACEAYEQKERRGP